MQPNTYGYLTYKSYAIYYEIYGPKRLTKPPLLVLHGGPGSAHNYLLGLSKISQVRQVIFYDQLGCGKSDAPEDDNLWTIETFVGEITAVREALHLHRIHLLGHSWGGMLAIEYLLTKPAGIKSAILASPMISMPLYQQEADKLKAALPDDAGKIMFAHEQAGTTNSMAYKKALALYAKQHIFRGDNYPAQYDFTENKNGLNIYHYMWGNNEAYARGSLKDWDRVNDLQHIQMPTLITSGQYDELTPWQASIARNNILGSELRIFTNGAHLTHIEQETDYLNALSAFINLHDSETAA